MRLLNVSTTEEEINETAVQHFEAQSVAAARWESQLDALRHAQRAAHRAWLMAALQDCQGHPDLATPTSAVLLATSCIYNLILVVYCHREYLCSL